MTASRSGRHRRLRGREREAHLGHSSSERFVVAELLEDSVSSWRGAVTYTLERLALLRARVLGSALKLGILIGRTGAR